MKAEHTLDSGIPMIGNISFGTSICQLYESPIEIFPSIGAYISTGLLANEQCICLYPEPMTREGAFKLLSDCGVDVAHYINSGQLLLFGLADAKLEKLLYDDDSIRTYWKRRISEASRLGFDGIRVVYEPLAIFQYDLNRTIEYAQILNSFISNYSAVFLSTYNLNRCTVKDIVNIVCQHEIILSQKDGQSSITRNSVNQQIRKTVQEARDFYITLLEEFPAYVWRAGLDAKCDYFNRNWLRFTGRTLEQEYGDGWAEGVHPDDLKGCFEIYITSFQARKPFEMEYQLKRYDGEYRWILDIGKPFYFQDGNFAGYIGSCFDITDRKKLEEALAAATTEAKRANAAKSEFLSHISHEIRTPLVNISGIVELLKLSDLTAEQDRYVDLASASSAHLNRLVNDLLDLAKIESGTFTLCLESFDLHQLLDEVVGTLMISAHKKMINLKLEMDPKVPKKVIGDEKLLRQILINLVNNGIKFTDQGEVVLRIKQCDALQQSTILAFQVSDTGIGISADGIGKLFKNFSQLSTAGHNEKHGTGLGLAISAQLVEQMGGRIEVSSTEGIGSTFQFRLELGL